MVRFSEIQEDGTYLVDASGDLHTMSYTDGYMVGVLELSPVEGERSDIITPGTLVGRWTDRANDGGHDSVYWDRVEYVDRLEVAEFRARQRGELAIWDNAAGKEIRV